MQKTAPAVMGVSPPFLYSTGKGPDAAFPTSTFDPKAVTRASWKPKPPRPMQHGPLLSFNRHPDVHALLSNQRGHYVPLGGQTKKWIKWLRVVQLVCRILEFNTALGILILLLLVTNIDEVAGMVMRILPGVATIHCLYAIYHLSCKESGRTPGSSAAYNVFAATTDFAIFSLYVFGAYSTYKESSLWASRPDRPNLIHYFVPAIYYMIIVVGGMHLISLSISSWLGILFRRISLLPPDMNPLEANFTTRPYHKMAKPSMQAASHIMNGKRQSISRAQGDAYGRDTDQIPQAPQVPFLHTREGCGSSSGTNSVSFIDLSDRQYGILPGNSPPCSMQAVSNKRHSTPVSLSLGTFSAEPNPYQKLRREESPVDDIQQTRIDQLSETSMLTDSSMSMTTCHGYMLAKPVATPPQYGSPNKNGYQTLAPMLKNEGISDHVHEAHGPGVAYDRPRLKSVVGAHANPRLSHPTAELKRQATTGLCASDVKPTNRQDVSLSGLSENRTRISNRQHIIQQSNAAQRACKRHRDSAVQLDYDPNSRSYVNLLGSRPPTLLGGERKISSAVDYGMSNRRNISGKIADDEGGYR